MKMDPIGKNAGRSKARTENGLAMQRPVMEHLRRKLIGVLTILAIGLATGSTTYTPALAEAPGEDVLKHRFEYLSRNGNSNCSPEFLESIATMSSVAMLQGSCCSPMDEHRYFEQVEGLRAYKDISMIPTDPYDIPAGLAQKLTPYYELELNATERAAYDYAMTSSDEQGPCCCECWRWNVYGGLAKYLVREHGFTGDQIADIWDLSDGCGGSGDHAH